MKARCYISLGRLPINHKLPRQGPGSRALLFFILSGKRVGHVETAQLDKVAEEYGLSIRYMETYGKVYKIYTDQGIFALKKADPQNGIDFIRNVHSLYQRGYNRIVPIYQAPGGKYAVMEDNQLYYLMPWLDNDIHGERTERHKQMFRELARMHTISVKDMLVDTEEREAHYNLTMKEWKKQQEFIKEFIVICEKKWYTSPFEMQFIRYYTDISQALDYSVKKMEQWVKKTKDDIKVRTVITHGNVSLKHFVYNERGFGYFINFERSQKAPPHFDLLPYLEKTAKTYPIQGDDAVDWLYNYFSYFPFKEEEMLLFQSYLAYPGQMVDMASQYFEKKGNRTESQYVKQLQRKYWQLKNIEYMVMKIESIEKAKKDAAAQAQQEANNGAE